VSTFTVNHHGFAKLKALGLYRSNASLAKKLGVDSATVTRLLNGSYEPGPRVLAGAVLAFGQAMFFELFHVIP
jgi:transcriptional regulator with XRE-family HTH domain